MKHKTKIELYLGIMYRLIEEYIYCTRWFTQGTAKGKLSTGVCCICTLSLGSVSCLYHIDQSESVLMFMSVVTQTCT